ncbi:hybrid sensor histidine kinase/response regulator transcription factor [Seonamhaeicola maritimus]|uniref:hybrid sensor histidine kinase/response regulator transcription factor n=1 Tax=Seonamhaeicola maritimus TaxID=2591822 RepID=UPI0024948610|nr:hybrid sensor histidine kinase/response regulator transcription factor [Seonamhaeicola maritimus]
MRIKAFFSISFFLMCYVLSAQFNNVKFENLDTTEGLSSSTCFEIFQDREGFLWFGTIDGLNKYNGYEFEIYRSAISDPNSISNNRVNVIKEDNEGNLWIGTNNGLNLYNKGTKKFIRIDLYKQLSLSSSPQKIINDLLYDEINNHLWVATNNGIIKIVLQDDNINSENFKFSYYINEDSNFNSIDNNNVNIILKDKNENIWAGTNGSHLNKYNAQEDNFDRVYIWNKKPYELNHLPKKVFIDADGDFLIGNDLSNLVLWNRSNNTFDHISIVEKSTPILGIYQDRNGLFWVTTDVNGIYLFEKGQYKVKQHIVNNISDPFSLPNNKPSKVFEDKDGIYWIGSYDKGVSKLDPSKYTFGHYYYKPGKTGGMSEKTAQSVLEDSKNRIWISTYNGGLNLFNEKENTFTHFGNNLRDKNKLSSNKILYTFETLDGNIWICTLDGGLNRFNPNSNTFETFMHDPSDSLSIAQNSVWAGVEDSKNRLWVALRTKGISLFDREKKHFYNYGDSFKGGNGLLSNNVLYVFIDSKERLLIGTSLGLNVVDLTTLDVLIPDELTFNHIDDKTINGTGINYITEDYLGNIWLGADNGIHKLNSNLKLVRSYSSEDGLPNNLVVGVAEDNNKNLWITTKGGLSLLNPVTNKFMNFNIHDGIQGPEYQSKSIERLDDGRILVGGINGFNIFHPNDIVISSPKALKPLITNFKLNNRIITSGDSLNNRVLFRKAIERTDNLLLKHDENYISFEFVALNFENPEQVQYAYKMQGLDDSFIYIGTNRNVNLSNLKSGEYTFEVKASTDGQWENVPTTFINIEILPPFWKTWWAYLIYFLISAGIVWIIIHFYTLKVQEEQQHELDQMKLKFFVNVSHEFRTPLTLILNPVDKILSSFRSDPETIKESAISIQRSARRLLHLVNQLLDYRKMDVGMAPLQLKKGDAITFVEDIFLLFKGLAFKKEIDYKFVKTSINISAFFDFDKIEKIVTNLISNAIKYTDSGGEIEVSIGLVAGSNSESKLLQLKRREKDGFLEISIRDTGVGLDKDQLKNVFSRFNNIDSTKASLGIGLNFTKALVELHGGNIFVESQLGKGSEFIVRLPLDLKASSTSTVKNIKDEFLLNSIKSAEYEMLSISDELVDNKSALKIQNSENKILPTALIVEDNKELRLHLINDLKANYNVIEAVNGEEGIKAVDKYFPDVIISDVMMPKMDGFEMCRILKTNFDTCHIPVLLLTARSHEEDRIEGYENGADSYLSKPFMLDVLKARVENLLAAKKRLQNRFTELGSTIPSSSEVTTNNIDKAFLDRTTKIIIDNIDDVNFKQEDLLKKVGIGRSQFYRKISALTGQNPSAFIRTIRLKYASEKLLSEGYSIKEVTYMAGFNSTAYFSKTFRELFNMTPTEFIEKHKASNERVS